MAIEGRDHFRGDREHGHGRGVRKELESDPAAGFIVMRRLAALIARYLASSGVQ